VAAKKNAQVINGFQSVQAVRRAGRASTRARTRESRSRLPDQEQTPIQPGTGNKATRIGHTAVPEKHELVCYACDYQFTTHGRIHNPFCPKCKSELDMSDHVVTGIWKLDVKTMGTIDIKADAVVTGATLIAQNMIVAGNIEDAVVQVTRSLELHPGAKLQPKTLTARNLTFHADSKFSIRRKLICHTVDIGGILRATLRAEESVTIRAGATFKGEIYTPRLIVEDGATISASMFLGQAVIPAREQKKDAA
jgi:cytoskeletal protein CcmA (bactofilin family)